METGALLSVIVFLLVLVLALFFRRVEGQPATASGPDPGISACLDGLSEKLGRLDLVGQGVNQVQGELKVLGEKVSSLERAQATAQQSLGLLASGLGQTGADITQRLGRDIAGIQQEVGALKAVAVARQQMDVRMAASIDHLEAVIAGSRSKGLAGENIVDVVFSKLPLEWQVRNFTVRGRSVEFGLRLPNSLVLPIDSKWAATGLLERYGLATEPAEQEKLKEEIRKAVLLKAREVEKYIDPTITASFGVAVVPDAVYELCSAVLSEAFRSNVVLVSYTMFVPYLLLVFQTTLKSGQSIDLQRLEAHLDTVRTNMSALQEELDGRFSRALTMLANSRDDMRAYLGRATGSLTSLAVPQALPKTAG